MGSSTGILCSFCDLLVGQTIQGLDREKEGKTYAEWLLSAQNGCPLCIYVVSDKAFECLQSDWQERPESMIYLTNWTRLRECPEIVYLWLSSDADRFDYPVRLRRCDSGVSFLIVMCCMCWWPLVYTDGDEGRSQSSSNRRQYTLQSNL